MHLTATVFFLYLLCTACASPLYLKARHNGDKSISRTLPSRPKTPDVDMEKIVLNAWDNNKGDLVEDKTSTWSWYRLSRPFENSELRKLFESFGLHGPAANGSEDPYVFIEEYETHNPADHKTLQDDINELKDLHAYLGSANKSMGKGVIRTYVIWWSRKKNGDLEGHPHPHPKIS